MTQVSIFSSRLVFTIGVGIVVGLCFEVIAMVMERFTPIVSVETDAMNQ